MNKKTLLLLDGHNIFIRAYSGLARQNLQNSHGVGTWGIYGTLNTIAGMIRKYEPSHILLAFDKGRSSKRRAIDPEYKANRNKSQEKKKDDDRLFQDFRPQLELTILFCEKIGIPFLRLQDVEADDILAKATREFSPIFEETVIVSADHDIQQLIRHNIKIVKPSLGQSRGIKEEILTVETVMSEWGVEPWRLPEIWALMGDKGDNVPGIPGIGPKKATKLIAEHGDLETVLSLDDPKIQAHLDVVRRAYSLIELTGEDDIPFPPLGNLQFQPTQYSDKTVARRELLELFDRYELNSIRDRWAQGTLWSNGPSFGRKLK